MANTGRRGENSRQAKETDVSIFSKELSSQRSLGFGFVPLLGAGLSAPSGVPITHEILSYLQKCIVVALGLHLEPADVKSADNASKPADDASSRRWQPWSDEWPRFSEFVIPSGCVSPAKDDPQFWLKHAAKVAARKIAPEQCVFREACGVMAEWRSALHFISRLRPAEFADASSDKTHETGIRLADRDADLIDTFFLNIVADKKPSMGHSAIALLSDLLRFDTVLTTNFDNLLEQAFLQNGIPVTPFEVHQESGLPQFAHIRHDRAIIKVHGGRYGLRADHSLDAEPNFEDQLRFVSYFARQHLTARHVERHSDSGTPGIKPRRHLFVAGISGTEPRVNGLIESAFRWLTSEFHVFWLCHTSTDVKNAELFRDNLAKKSLNDRLFTEQDAKDRFHILHHGYLELFFVQLYQYLTHGLPPSATVFPASPRIPVPVEPRPYSSTSGSGASETTKETANPKMEAKRREMEAKRREIEKLAGEDIAWQTHIELDDKIGKTQDTSDDKESGSTQTIDFSRLIIFSSPANVHGVCSVAADEFHARADGKDECLWLEMDEVSSTDDLWEQLFDAVLKRVGQADWKPVLRGDSKLTRARELDRVTGSSPYNWVIYLNARDGAGSTFHRSGRGDHKDGRVNGWISTPPPISSGVQVRTADDESEDRKSFLELLHAMTSNDLCRRFTFVLLCQDDEGLIKEVTEIRNRTSGSSPSETSSWKESNIVRLEESCTTPFKEPVATPQPSAGEVKSIAVEAALNWVQSVDMESETNETSRRKADCKRKVHDDKYRFLAALILANRSRYPAMLLSWAFHPRPEDAERNQASSEETDMRLRYYRTETWLEELEELGIVRRKTGGFVWLHSTIRNDLRCELAKLRERDEWNKTAADIHHGLATWYRKLFMSSSSPLAICEIATHRLYEAGFALRLKSDAGTSRARRALIDGIRCLKVGRKPMLSGGYTMSTCRRLFELRENVEDTRKELEELGRRKHKKKVLKLLNELFDESFAMNSEIAEETGEYEMAVKRLADARDAVRKRSDTPAKASPEMWELPDEPGAKHLSSDDFESLSKLGTLLIANRSYKLAHKKFQKIYEMMGFPSRDLRLKNESKKKEPSAGNQRTDWGSERTDRILDWLHQQSPQRTLKKRAYRIVSTLQRQMQLVLVRGQAIHLQSRRPRDDDEKRELRKQSERLYKQAVTCYRVAIEILLAIPRVSQHKFFDQWQKLETQHGLAWAYLRDFRKAHRRLDEAESCLGRAGLDHKSLEFAVIELHRAEILTQQAVFEESPDDVNRMTTLGRFREDLRSIWTNTDDCRHGIIGTLLPDETKRAMLQCGAYLDDALNALDRAYGALELQRKNVWWTTWYFELKLKVIELKLFSAITDKELPYIDLKEAPFGAKTEVDRLLTDSTRMTRLDVFRLSRVVEAYAHCLFALISWLVKDTDRTLPSSKKQSQSQPGHPASSRSNGRPATHILQPRCEDMKNELVQATRTLIAALAKRDNVGNPFDSSESSNDTSLCPSQSFQEIFDKLTQNSPSKPTSEMQFPLSEDVRGYAGRVCRTVDSILSHEALVMERQTEPRAPSSA